VIAGPGSVPELGLRRLLWINVGTTATAVIMLLAVHLLVYASPYVLVLAALVACAGGVMALGSFPLRAGRPAAAVAYLAVANYLAALLATSIATFAMPVLLVSSLLPAVLAVPYVSRGLLRWYVAGSFVTALGVAMLGSLQDVTGFSDDLPTWVPPTVIVGFTPFVAGMVAFMALTNATALRANAEALRVSRARVVAAGDRERRRIERDLHDGAQQRLTGVAVRLARTQERIAEVEPAAAGELGELRQELRGAIVELRDLAHGIYPPALTERGLTAAVRNALATFPLPVAAELSAAGRYPPGAENAVYFCCLEALQNVLKHAPSATRVAITLAELDATLRFEVQDDGPGFDQSAQASGVGFDNMADRLGAVGGDVAVTSALGRGTSVVGVVPLVAGDHAVAGTRE
jgi:signal transduction histidine kinase